MTERSRIFRNSDVARRSLERAVVCSGGLVDLERLIGEAFRTGRLFMPTSGAEHSAARVPDTLGRHDGLILSIKLDQPAFGPWRSSEDKDQEISEHGSLLKAIAARRRAEEAGGLRVGESGWVDAAVRLRAELASGLPAAFYRHGIMNDIPWDRFWHEETLRSEQATPAFAIKWLMRAAAEVADHVAVRQQAFDRFTQRVGSDPRVDQVAAWHALMGYYAKNRPSGPEGWSGALAWLDLVRPPLPPPPLRVDMIRPPTASGYGYAWAAMQHMRSELEAWTPGVIVTPYYMRDYGPFSTESSYHAFARSGVELSTRRARRSHSTMPVEVRYPTLMGLGGDYESETTPVAGRWTIGLGSDQPSTIQALYRPVIDVIRRDFPGAEIFVRDTDAYPADYEGRRLGSGYH